MTIDFKHDTEITKLPSEIDSVVALEFSFVDALVALDVTVKGIADDDSSNNLIEPIKQEVGDYVSVGTRVEPNLETIKTLSPQLIIADTNRHKDIYEHLSEIGPTILLSSFNASYKENLEVFQRIGKAVSKTEEAKSRLEKHHKIVEYYNNQITINKDKKTLAVVVSEQGITAHSDETYVGEFLSMLGFKNSLNNKIVDHLSEYKDAEYLEMSYDQLVDANPQRIIIMAEDSDKTYINDLENSKQWNKLDAVQNRRIHLANRDVWAKFRGLISSEDIVRELASFKE